MPMTFHMVEVGARPVGLANDPFQNLLAAFPGSQLTAFEVEPDLCARLNTAAPPNVRYIAQALGCQDETRPFYVTQDPMCSSLFPPDERYADYYHDMEYMRLRAVESIATRRLDHVLAEENLPPVDFMKLDVQGAELDVLGGTGAAIEGILMIESEVEFVPLYRGQPLFGEVTGFLAERELVFHKFRGLAGRTLRPIVIDGASIGKLQMLWAEALYVRSPFHLDQLMDIQLLKLALLADAYLSPDLAFLLLSEFDRRHATALALEYIP